MLHARVNLQQQASHAVLTQFGAPRPYDGYSSTIDAMVSTASASDKPLVSISITRPMAEEWFR